MTVEIDEKNTVEIRKLSYGEEQVIKQKATKIAFHADRHGEGEGEVTFDAQLMEEQTLVKSIVSWSGPGFEGRPVNRQNILDLDSTIIEQIKDGINSLGQGLSEDEKKVSEPSTKD
jgi:hypothetical protein